MPLNLNSNNKRPSFTNFPIPFDHPYTIPILSIAVGASALFYYSLQAQHKAELREAVRLEIVKRRKKQLLKRNDKKDRYASLKIDGQFVNPFEEWHPSTSPSPLLSKLYTNWTYFKRLLGGASINEAATKQAIGKLSIEELLIQQPTAASFTWLGQSSCLFRLERNIGILTDPAPSAQLPCRIEDLAKLTGIVLISHQHPKHLEESTVLKLGNTVTWYVPLGLKSWFLRKGIDNVIELDWWQEVEYSADQATNGEDISIICVPAMHESSDADGRKNETLWCSYVIKSRIRTLFFCGDSGYVPDLFQTIYKLYGPFMLATLPVEEGGDNSSSSVIHMKLEEALEAHKDLGAPMSSVGIHWDPQDNSTCSTNVTKKKRTPRAYLLDNDGRSNGFISIHIGQTLSF